MQYKMYVAVYISEEWCTVGMRCVVLRIFLDMHMLVCWR